MSIGPTPTPMIGPRKAVMVTTASILIAALAASTLSAAAAPGGIDGYRWRSRLLVVIAPDPGDPRLEAQKRVFATDLTGTRERDLVLLEGSGDQPGAADLRRRFGVPRDAYRSILVGKDGRAKLSSAEPISAEALFDEIDQMPMRRDEMQRSPALRRHEETDRR